MSQEKITLSDFEKSLNDLEELVRKLEQGELPLEESLAAFERGVKLTRSCQQALRAAEQRVQQVVEQGDGSISVRAFQDEDGDDPESLG